MIEDTIKLGETYDISIAPTDADDVPLILDDTWAAVMRITRGQIGGVLVVEPVLTIADGVATVTIDTRANVWGAGIYIYDIRLTDPAGNDYWSEPIRLTVENRNAPASA